MTDQQSGGTPALDELDLLMNESLAIRDADTAAKQMRDKLKRQNLPSSERAEIEAKVREWEARREYTNVANVAVFERCTCDYCESVSTVYSHLMIAQEHRTNKQIKRLIVSDTEAEIAALPNFVAFQDMTVGMCPECIESHGYDLKRELMQWAL